MKTEYREVISLLHNGYSVRDVAKLSGNGVSTVPFLMAKTAGLGTLVSICMPTKTSW